MSAMPDYEVWTYRGCIVIAAYIIGWLFMDRFKQQSKIWGVVQSNKEANDKALAEARAEFTATLRDTVSDFRNSLGQLNQTVSGVGDTLRALQISIGREYATRQELKDVKDELKSDFKNALDREKPDRE